MRADLHTHTTASDGSLSPEELVRAAVASGLDVIAITDHDTVAGVTPAVAAAGAQLRIVPGIELGVLYEGYSVHLLAYGIDTAYAPLLTRLRGLGQGREERAREISSLLAAAGAPIPWERVTALGRDRIGRPHIARVLVEEGHARDIADAFARFIGEGAPAYLPSSRMTPQEAIAFVHDAGGDVALAHAALLDPAVDQARLLDDLCAAGLGGLEVYHSAHDEATRRDLRHIADQRGLWWCGGSDFHGPTKAEATLGASGVPDDVLAQGPFPALLGVHTTV